MLRSVLHPCCHPCEAKLSLVATTPDLKLVSDPVELLTSVGELEAFVTLIGVEGLMWMGLRIQEQLDYVTGHLKKVTYL